MPTGAESAGAADDADVEGLVLVDCTAAGLRDCQLGWLVFGWLGFA